jgi:asparagine synthase (glutamine-hydrolysing)
MCGIAGFFRPGDSAPVPPDERAALQRMNDAITHRGPDEEGLWCGPGVGLAARRLSIIDVAASHQPQVGPSGQTVCVFNGEIYNFAAIRQELIAAGHRFETNGDTEVLPHAYERWGIDGMLQRLNGMFAFAIFDGRSGELFVARDRLGIKPLYFGRFGQTCLFGSELKSLVLHPAAERSICPDALARYLMLEYVPSPRSIYRGIDKVVPGHYVRVGPDGVVQSRRYWSIDWAATEPRPATDDVDAWGELLTETLTDAIRLRLVSEVPIGSLLSGGVDSSAVSALMAGLVPDLRTFSIDFEEESFDESPFSQAVARRIGSRHTARTFSADRFTEILHAVRGFVDEPFADASILPTHFLSRTVKEEGVTVVLSGDGADELFAGYPTYYAQKVAKAALTVPGSAPAMKLASALAERWLPSSYDNVSTDYKVRRFLAGATLSPGRRQATWLGSFTEPEMRGVLDPDVRRQLAGDTPWSEIDALVAEPEGACGLERLCHLDLRTYMGDDILVKVDRASMAVSLEVRVPFLDHRVVELAAAMPWRHKLRGSEGKHVLKRAMRRHLPRQILTRSKKGFGMPVAHWLRGPWRELLLDTLGGGGAAKTGWFDQSAVDRLIDEHLSGRRDRRRPLWTLLMFRWWEDGRWGPGAASTTT